MRGALRTETLPRALPKNQKLSTTDSSSLLCCLRAHTHAYTVHTHILTHTLHTHKHCTHTHCMQTHADRHTHKCTHIHATHTHTAPFANSTKEYIQNMHTHSLTHSDTDSLTHTRTHSYTQHTHTNTHTPTHALTHSRTHSLTHSHLWRTAQARRSICRTCTQRIPRSRE